MTIPNNQSASQLPHINTPLVVKDPTACNTSTEDRATVSQMPFSPFDRINAHINRTL